MKDRAGIRPLAMATLAALLLATGCTALTPGPAPAPTQTPTMQMEPVKPDAIVISRPATDLPAPIARSTPTTVVVNLETTEVVGKLADGVTYTYWTYGGKVPGPMIRVRVGDSVELHLKNSAKSSMIHSIDLHAVSGPGGGAPVLQVKPGEEKVLHFKALNPGLYLYHCGTPHIPTHVALGMFGAILVEPEGGLPKVDKEFYVAQSEVYTQGDRDAKGHLQYDGNKLFHEDPNYVVFNGAFQALTGDMAMHAKVGDKIRIFFADAGPNKVSSLHVIGAIFDKVYPEGASEPISNVQTTLVPAGGGTIVEFTPKVPGNYVMVDHSISRAIDKGAMAVIQVDGADNPDVYKPEQ